MIPIQSVPGMSEGTVIVCTDEAIAAAWRIVLGEYHNDDEKARLVESVRSGTARIANVNQPHDMTKEDV